MMNRRELEKMLQHLKAEYMEALERGNERIQNNIVNQILNLEVTLKEDEFKNNMKEVKVDDEVDFVFDETEAFRQKVIVKSFSNKLKELYKKYHNTTTAQVSVRQAETIMAGIRDRVGMDIFAKQIECINN